MENVIELIKQQNAEGAKDVFLSYRSTGVDFASRVYEELENNQIETWFDKAILHNFVGNEYKEIIHTGIDNSKLLLLIYTDDIKNSDFIIKEELGYATKVGKPIFCYTKDIIKFNEMGEELRELLQNIQWLTNADSAKYIHEYNDAIKDEEYRRTLAGMVHDLSNKYSIFTDVNLFLIRVEIQKFLGLSTPYGNYNTLCNADDVYKWDNIDITVLNKKFIIDIPKEYNDKLLEQKFFTIDENKKEEAFELKTLLDIIKPEDQEIKNDLFHFIHANYNLRDIKEWLLLNRKEFLSDKEFTAKEFLDTIARYIASDFVSQIEEQHKTFFNGAMTGLYEVYDNRTENDEQHLLEMRMYHTDYFTFKCMVEIYHILRSIKDCFSEINKSNLKEYAAFFSSLGIGGYIVVDQEDAMSLMWARRSNTISSGNMWHFSFDETSSVCKDGIRENGKLKLFKDNAIKIDAKHYMHRGIWEEDGIHPSDLTGQQGIMELGIIKSERLEVELLSYAVINRPLEPSLPQQMEEYRRNAPDGKLEIAKIEFVPLINSINRYTGRLLTPEANHLSMRLNSIYNDFSSDRRKEEKHISKDVKFGSNIKIGKSCLIEDYCKIGNNCVIGDQCRIHRNVFIDDGVVIGNRVKIQNNNSIYSGVVLEDGVFVGTNVCFTNDRYPRAIRRNNNLPVTNKDWKLEETKVCYGASIGSGAVIRCGVTIGKWAMVGAGAVVVDNVPDFAIVVGNPAKFIKYIDMKDIYTPNPVDTSSIQLPEELSPLLEAMAKNVHEVWAKNRIEQGWRYGPERNDKEKLHPMLIPYEELPEEEKVYDRGTSTETLKLILKLGFTINR